MEWRKAKVALAIGDGLLMKQCREIVEKFQDVTIVAEETNGEKAYYAIKQTRPDIVIAQVLMPGMGVYTIIELLEKQIRFKMPQFILCYYIMPEIAATLAVNEHVLNYLVLPMKERILEQQIRKTFDHYIKKRCLSDCKKQYQRAELVKELGENIVKQPLMEEDNQLMKIVSYELEHLGAATQYKGYRYLLYAICHKLVFQRNQPMKMMELYPLIAKEMNTTPGGVEHAMRNCVEQIWSHGNIGYIKDFLGVSYVNPTNKPANNNFISIVADRIKQEYLYF